ncbi:MAG: hypothetical protein ACREBQ_13255, partial [Nitrososphaerales archaeon]
MALIVLVLILLPLAQVPILQLSSGSTPQYNLYTSGGATGNTLPETPEGWLVNSSIPLNLRGDLYSVKNVYVPVSNPERSNYTLYYELAQGLRTNMSNTWGNLVGWNRTVTTLYFAGLGGSLVIYTSRNTTFIVYSGTERLTFLQPFRGQNLATQLSFTRNFSSSVSLALAASTFVTDLQTYWLSSFPAVNSASGWSAFFFSIYSLFLSLYALLAVLASSGVFVFIVFRAMQTDSKTDRFLTLASELEETKWLTLSSLIESSAHPKT